MRTGRRLRPEIATELSHGLSSGAGVPPAATRAARPCKPVRLGLMGLGLAELSALRALASERAPHGKSVIFIFLTGGLSHQDSFDLKPDAPGQRSRRVPADRHADARHAASANTCRCWPSAATVRLGPLGGHASSNGHEIACHMLLTGRLDLPVGFSLNKVPNGNEWPSMLALVTHAERGPQQPAAGGRAAGAEHQRGRPGPARTVRRPARAALGGLAPATWPSKCPLGNGACPHCFRFDGTPFQHAADADLRDAAADAAGRRARRGCNGRLGLLERIEQSAAPAWSGSPRSRRLDRHRQQAISVLTSPKVRAAFDVETGRRADPGALRQEQVRPVAADGVSAGARRA